jgi:hypothetical protein
MFLQNAFNMSQVIGARLRGTPDEGERERKERGVGIRLFEEREKTRRKSDQSAIAWKQSIYQLLSLKNPKYNSSPKDIRVKGIVEGTQVM